MTAQTTVLSDQFVLDDIEKGIFRVNRRAFTDPAIMEAERRLVFDQSWLYVGHESELPEPGSYIKRKVGGRPLIFVRGDDNQIRLLFDACTHRGNSVCRGNRGTTQRFLCFYHGWGYNTQGDLVTVPDPMGYGDKMDKSKLGLGSPPRMESYRGLVFMSMKKDIVDLKTFLAGALPYIDDMLDVTVSEPVIAPGQQSYGMKANWKLLMENSADAYHAPYTHQRFFNDFISDMGGSVKEWQAISRQGGENRVIPLGNGHSIIDTPSGPLPMQAEKPELFQGLRDQLTAKYGEERMKTLLDRSRNLLIFPNLVIISSWRTIRTFYPVTPDYLECEAWAIVGKDDTPEMREMRFNNFISFLGPAGFGTPDDVEALENCQKAFAATEMAWTDMSKGMGREGGAVANDELQMREIWRQWSKLMTANFKPSDEPGAYIASSRE